MANFQGLLTNPAVAMGAGILANNTGHYGAFGPAVGGGLLAAMQEQRRNRLTASDIARDKAWMEQNRQLMEERTRTQQREQEKQRAYQEWATETDPARKEAARIRLMSFEANPMSAQQNYLANQLKMQEAQRAIEQRAAQERAGAALYDTQSNLQNLAAQGSMLGDPNALGNAQKAYYAALGQGDPIAGRQQYLTTQQGLGPTQYAKINPSEYTPESLRQFAATGDYSALRQAQSPTTPGDRFNIEYKLANNFDKSANAFKEISGAWTAIQAIPESAIGDVALATKIMKILDPGSVVRESELGVALSSTGLMQRMLNYAKKAQSGQMLNPAQRQEFRNLAESLYKAAQSEFNKLRTRYTDKANRYKVDPRNVVYDYSSTYQPPTPPDTQPEVKEAPENVVKSLPKVVRSTGRRRPVRLSNHKIINGVPVAKGSDDNYYQYIDQRWQKVEK